MTISLKQSLAGLAAAIAIAAAFIAPKEGLRLIAYRDIVGVPTICYGETRDVEMGDVKTKAECDAMLQKRVEEFAVTLAPCMQG
jgi:lysozyme